MADFSFGEAVGAGFKVIGRRPQVVLIWALAYLALVVVPIGAVLAHLLPEMIANYRAATVNAMQHGSPNPGRLMAHPSRMFGLQPVIWLVQLVSRAILMGAIYRAVLEPENSKWGYLRLSRQELWLGLTNLVFSLVTAVLVLTVMVPLSIGMGIGVFQATHGAAPTRGAVILLCAIGVVALGAIAWVLARLSLALPMAFAERRFVLYDSWSLTRGHGPKIIGVIVVLLLIIWACEFAIGGLAWSALAHGLVNSAEWRTKLQAPPAEAARNLLPLLAGIAAVGSVIGMTVYAILVAPLASIYRQLKEAAAVA